MSRSSELHRKVDYYAGVPLAYVLGGLRPRRRVPGRPARIGFLQPTAIGDTVLGSGVMGALARAFPDAVLSIFHGKSNAPAVAMLGMRVTAEPCDFLNPVAAITQLRRHRLDVLVDFTPWPRLTGLLAFMSGAKCTIGFRSPGQHRHWWYDQWVDFVPGRHVGESLDGFAHLFGLKGHHPPCLALQSLPPPPDLATDPDRLVLLHTRPGGSRAAAKSWPTDHWVETARALIADGWTVGLTGTAADAGEVGEVVAAIDRPGSCLDLCGRLTLGELAAALRRAALVISVDTGVLHLASAVGARVVGLHGPTSARMWGATSPTSVGLDASHPDSGYIHFGFETCAAEGEIMATLPARQVVAVARRILTTPPGQGGPAFST